jgi:hypothetical protein
MRATPKSRLKNIVRQVKRGGLDLIDRLPLVRLWVWWEGLNVSERDLRRAFSRPPSKRRRQDCLDCGVDTFAIREYPYKLRDELWHAIVPGGDGMLCKSCVSVRLGRPLTRKDVEEEVEAGMKTKTYTLFATGPNGRITNKSINYGSTFPWIVTVRANSISQAYALLAGQVVAKHGGVGITQINRKEDVKVGWWPWAMSRAEVYPEWDRYLDT